MERRWGLMRLGFVAAGMLVRAAVAGDGDAEKKAAFVARVVHPDRQAAEVLRLFDGARWPDPAAALAAWKQARAGGPDVPMNKPAEAVIAMFNPEMVREWRAFDGAEVRVDVQPAGGRLEWFARVPHDDGVLAAGVTAMRLSYPEDRPLTIGGREHPVARLSRSGLPLAGQDGSVVVIAGSRDSLLRGLEIGTGPAVGRADLSREPGGPGAALPSPDSGLVFRLLPGELPALRELGLAPARAVEALRAIGCRRVDGTACLKDGTLALDVRSAIDGAPARPGEVVPDPPAVDPAWLASLPSAGVMAAVSMAIDPRAPAWERTFALADRVERVDPARAGLSPVRVRLNLLAAAAGLKLEGDLLPHLRGASVVLFGQPDRPGRVTGALVVLHLDDPEVARRVVRDSSARLAAVLSGRTPAPDGGDPAARAVVIRALGGEIRVAWGDARTVATADKAPPAGHSLADVCCGWLAEGRAAPSRVGAFWPGRLWQPTGRTPWPGDSLQALADDPPAVWWGWTEPAAAHDLVRWRGLNDRVRRFLATLPVPAR